MLFGCATPVAILQISAPSSVTAGTPFTITVTAMDNGSRDTIFDSYINFTSSDSAAILPSHYQFTAADAGSHTFVNAVTLTTPGTQSLTATMIYAPSITGTTTITVSAANSATESYAVVLSMQAQIDRFGAPGPYRAAVMNDSSLALRTGFNSQAGFRSFGSVNLRHSLE